MWVPREGALVHVREALQRAESENSGHTAYSASRQEEQDLVQELIRHHGSQKPLTETQRRLAIVGPLADGEEVLLRRIRERLDRSGYQWPGVTVSYSDVSVTCEAVTMESSLPSLISPVTQALKCGRSSTIKALDNVSGVLRPGSFTLLLGPPGSGRSTLLKLLSGRLKPSSTVTVQGAERILYNGRSTDSFVLPRTASYVDQVDGLLATLSVRETLDFAEMCAGSSQWMEVALAHLMSWEAAHSDQAQRTDLDDEADRMMVLMMEPHHLLQTEYMLHILGLRHAANTVVGDALLRGVSGGERKRVAVGEGLVAQAPVLLLDEVSTGLDSASTLALTQSLRRSAKLLNATIITALLQPEPEVVAEFDDILLLSEGRVLWHGPKEEALAHFGGLGLKPLPGQDLAEFLQQLAATKDQWCLLDGSPATGGGGRGARKRGPYTTDQLTAAFWDSSRGRELKAASGDVMVANKVELASLEHLTSGTPWPALLKACTQRLFKVEFARNWEACAIRWALALFMALVTGLLFLQLPVTFTGGLNLLGMLFQSLFFMQLLSVPTIELTFEKRPILFKQRDSLMYPAWVEWLPSVALNAPVVLVDTLLYATPLYFMVGFTASAPAFFTFLLVLFGFALLCDNLYRVYGAASQVLTFAVGIGTCQGLANEMLAGFVITPGSMPAYWKWAYWINPQAYAFRALALSELQQARWSNTLVAGTTSGTTMPLGAALLELFEIPLAWDWVWGGVGVLFGMGAFCACMALVAYTFNRIRDRPAVLLATPQEEKSLKAPGKHSVHEQKARGAPVEAGCEKVSEHKIEVDGGALTKAAPDAPSHVARDAKVLFSRSTTDYTSAALRSCGGSSSSSGCLRGVTVTFKDLCYSVPSPGGGRQQLTLLQSITGYFKPRLLTALMGASGAGKTTLMDVIAGRKTAGTISGTICVDGYPQDQTHFARLAGYVEQADIHAPLTTVREALTFSAALRLPMTTTAAGPAGAGAAGPAGAGTAAGAGAAAAGRKQALEAVVESTLDMVELRVLAGAIVGTPGVDGLSTEQRKRLTIAVELVTQPRIVFLDEPTSGLDARSAALIAKVMHSISRRSVTVVSTIHQPSQAIFSQFDELLLLKRGGQVVFFGPLGEGACKLINHFEALPEVAHFQQGRNPAAWMLEVVSGPAAVLPTYPDLAEHYQLSSMANEAAAAVEVFTQPQQTSCLAQLQPPSSGGTVKQTQLLLARNLRSYWRNPASNLSRLLVTLAMSLIVGSIELGKGDVGHIHGPRDIQNFLGAIFMLAAALAVEIGFECQSGLSKERVVFYREKAAACYGAGPYLAAQVLTEVAFISVQVLLYTLITFFMMQLEVTAASFFYVLLLVWLSCLVAFLSAQAFVQATPVMFIATTLFAVVSNIQGLTGGFTRPLPVTPMVWWPAYYLNPYFYAFMGLGSKFLGGLQTLIPNPEDPTGPAVAVNDFVKQVYGFQRGVFPGPYGSLAMLVALGSVMFTVSFLSLKHANFQRR